MWDSLDFANRAASIPTNQAETQRQYSPFDAAKIGQAGAWTGPTGFDTTPTPATSPLSRGQVSFPIAEQGYQAPPASATQGDIFGSIAAATSDAQSHLNLGNVVPYLIERNQVAADQLNRQLLANTPLAPLGTIGAGIIDTFTGAIKAAADVAAPIMNDLAIPVDWGLNDSVNSYRGLVKDYNAIKNSGQAVSQQLTDAMAMHSLPPELQTALQQNPDLPQADVNKLLDTYGRQWTYDPSLLGMATNLMATAASYAPEMLIGGAAFGAVKGASWAARAAETIGSLPGGSTALSVASRAIPLYAKVQKAALVSGASQFALSTAMDTLARVNGDQSALDYWERMNSTTPISNDPNVQLVTAFTINPLGPILKGIKGVKLPDSVPVFGGHTVGILPLAKGMGNIILHAPGLSATLTKLYTGGDANLALLGKAYGRTVDQMRDWVGPDKVYANDGAVATDLLNTAMDVVKQQLPTKEREGFMRSYTDGKERTQAFLNAYAPQIDKVLANPDLMASAMRQKYWGYANLQEPFKPERMAQLSADYRAAQAKSFEIRARMDAVLGYPDVLRPDAAATIRSEIADIPGDTIPMGALDDIKVQYSAMRRLDSGLIEPGAPTVPKAAVEQMVARGEQAYTDVLRTNPYRLKTGTEPVLYPKAGPTQVADAVGATAKQAEDLMAAPGKGTDYEGLRQYVGQQYAPTAEVNTGSLSREQVAALTNQEVWSKAHEAFSTKYDAAVARGQRLASGRSEIAILQKQIANADVAGDKGASAAYRSQLGKLQEALDISQGPVTTYSEAIAGIKAGKAETIAEGMLRQKAMRRVDAEYRLSQLNALTDVATRLTNGEIGPELFDMVRDGRWAGDTPPMPTWLKTRLAQYINETAQAARVAYPGAETAFPEAGDYTLWSMAKKFYESGNPRFARDLSLGQRTALDGYLGAKGSVKLGWGPDDVADLMTKSQGTAETARFTGEQAVEQIARLREARDSILGSETMVDLRRSATLKNIPEGYVHTAQGELANGAVYDPSYAAHALPEAIAKLQSMIDSNSVDIDAVRTVVFNDPTLFDRLATLADKRGLELGQTLSPDEYLQQMLEGKETVTRLGSPLQRLIPEGFVAPQPGVIASTGPLDDALIRGDAVDESSGLVGVPGQVEPLRGVPLEDAQRAVGAPKYTGQMGRKFNASGADMNALIDPAKLADPANRLGTDGLSLILWGKTGMPPSTLRWVMTALREIENGHASQIGLGDGVLAEAQRVGRQILDSALGHVQVAEYPPGLFMQGLNPAAFGEEMGTLARDLFKNGMAIDDQFGIQYGFDRRPNGALITEMESMPGVAQEYLLGHYRGYEERIGLARTAADIGAFFSLKANSEIVAANRARFREGVVSQGGTAQLGDAVWDEWRTKSRESHNVLIRKNADGALKMTYGPHAFYADIRNLPNGELNAAVHGIAGKAGVLDRYYQDAGLPVPESLRSTDFADLFRESSSFTRRALMNLPLGDGLARLYGNAVHSSTFTTTYYWLRFRLDPRMIWMNNVESVALYAGHSGLMADGMVVPGQEALFGINKEAFSHLADDGMSNTGYPAMGNRAAWAYRDFTKHQTPELLDLMKTITKEDAPKVKEIMDGYMKDLATYDPELSATIKAMGDTPEAYLRLLHSWHSRLLAAADPAALVSRVIGDASTRDPAMAELYGRIAERNTQLIQDTRELFFGNPNRSQFERMMNHYLLFWPISYQLKAAKWWTKVLFDSVGGLPTNAGGAYILNQVAVAHQRALKDDPTYAQTIADNPTLLFLVQMMFPLSPLEPLSWSLSPGPRDALFGGSKAIWDIGPLYTFGTLAPRIATELYRDVGDLPLLNTIYPMVSGNQPPKPKAPAPVMPAPPLDTSRWTG